jgi:hypothetical protein
MLAVVWAAAPRVVDPLKVVSKLAVGFGRLIFIRIYFVAAFFQFWRA